MKPYRTTLNQSTFGNGGIFDSLGRTYKLDVETALSVAPNERAFVYMLPRGVPPPHMGPNPDVIEFVTTNSIDETVVIATGTVTSQYPRSKGKRCRTGVVVVRWKWIGWILTEDETLRPDAMVGRD